MEKLTAILIPILLVMTSCGGGKQSGTQTDDVIIVDVTASYPKKELILQDFMDVEYIPLETNDDFIHQGFVQDIGKEIIIVKNRNDDGDIFIYDRTGKALRKINRKGQGGEEYTNIYQITLDEDHGEMFINDIFRQKMFVYDLYGNFKRSFKHKEDGGSLFYTDVFNYDNDHLICYDAYNEEIPFVLISKQDGRIIKEIKIPFKEKKLLQQQRQEGEMTYTVTPGPHRAISPFKSDWILLEFSSDTVYQFLPDYSLRPFLIRKPPLESMDPEEFFILRFFSDRYFFMETIKNEYDFDTADGFPRTFFMYDREEKAFFRYIIHNGDFSFKKEVYMNMLSPVNHEIESWQTLESHQLVGFYKRDQLKGKLKEIAAELDEESNPVLMLVKHKK